MIIPYITLEELLRIHFQVIEDYGGSHGVRDEGRLLSVTEAPKQNAFGHEQYPTIYLNAAVYLRNIIGDHPFTDGNKRTAITICVIFLARNKKFLSAKPKELEDFTIKVATDHLSVEETAYWLELKTKDKAVRKD